MLVGIAGGGIGGLTAALCLARRGFQVQVFEQTPNFLETGAGVQLSPNCSRVLHELGLAPELAKVAVLPERTQIRQWRTGKIISANPLGPAISERYGAPYYHIHRGDLLQLLVAAAQAEPAIKLCPGQRISAFAERSDQVVLHAGQESQAVDVLIGADGIHSLVRKHLWGDEAPQFTGNIAWRAQVPLASLPRDLVQPNATVWWGPGKHFVHYLVRGGTQVNCVCVVEKSGWEVESWTEQGSHSELKSDFKGWHANLQTLIDQADPGSLYKWGLFDRAPMPNWGRGRVSLLGDACHPTLPFMAQGAAMAIEDAVVLAGCLSGARDPAHGLARYEALRRERTAAIQRGSRRNAKVFHLSGIKAWLRNRAAGAASKGTMGSIYSYNAPAIAEAEAEALVDRF